MAKKFYVVWVGRETGVFSSWPQTKKLVDQYPSAKYKSFKTENEADAAFKAGWNSSKAVKPTANLSTATAKKTPVNESMNQYDTVIYCDGGCDPNPGKAASGVAIYRKGQLSELWYGLFNPQGTNNTAELNALYQSLCFAENAVNKAESVQILCDSLYSINCVTVWAFGWKTKGWKRKIAGDIKNLAIIQQSHELYISMSSKINVSHIKAHAGFEGNELADRMSIYGIAQKDTEFCQYTESLDVPKILDFKAG